MRKSDYYMTTCQKNFERETDMASYAWILGIRPGYEDEYHRRHDEIWPEMTEALKQSGIRNYNIFKYGLDLFGYFETDDLEFTQKFLAENDVNKRWAEYMAPIMKVDIDPRTNFPYLLPNVFHHA